MGYNSNCTVQTCTQNCCNTYGQCPSTSTYASTLSKTCKYYYTSSTSTGPLSTGATVGIAIAPVIFIVVLVVGIVCCVKRCQAKRMQEIMKQKGIQGQNVQVNMNTLGQPSYPMGNTMGNPMLNMTTQNLATEYTDPNQVMLQNQQMYGQPYVQPSPYGQPNLPPFGQMQPQPFANPEQALFGQPMGMNQPNMYPGMNNYGPGPIVQ